MPISRGTGSWPTIKTGELVEAPGENWNAISASLSLGFRGLPGGWTLPQLLEEARGVRNKKHLPPLRVREILKWADAYYVCHGSWPIARSGPIPDSGGESWKRVHNALYVGGRGFPGGSSLPKLLSEWRGTRCSQNLPDLTVEQILQWADRYFAARGRWPARQSGGIPKTRGETWRTVDTALSRGRRGLPGGMTLSGLLDENRRRDDSGAALPTG